MLSSSINTLFATSLFFVIYRAQSRYPPIVLPWSCMQYYTCYAKRDGHELNMGVCALVRTALFQ